MYTRNRDHLHSRHLFNLCHCLNLPVCIWLIYGSIHPANKLPPNILFNLCDLNCGPRDNEVFAWLNIANVYWVWSVSDSTWMLNCITSTLVPSIWYIYFALIISSHHKTPSNVVSNAFTHSLNHWIMSW